MGDEDDAGFGHPEPPRDPSQSDDNFKARSTPLKALLGATKYRSPSAFLQACIKASNDVCGYDTFSPYRNQWGIFIRCVRKKCKFFSQGRRGKDGQWRVVRNRQDCDYHKHEFDHVEEETERDVEASASEEEEEEEDEEEEEEEGSNWVPLQAPPNNVFYPTAETAISAHQAVLPNQSGRKLIRTFRNGTCMKYRCSFPGRDVVDNGCTFLLILAGKEGRIRIQEKSVLEHQHASTAKFHLTVKESAPSASTRKRTRLSRQEEDDHEVSSPASGPSKKPRLDNHRRSSVTPPAANIGTPRSPSLLSKPLPTPPPTKSRHSSCENPISAEQLSALLANLHPDPEHGSRHLIESGLPLALHQARIVTIGTLTNLIFHPNPGDFLKIIPGMNVYLRLLLQKGLEAARERFRPDEAEA
ncbi:hypothetical protein T439DRAFT_140773 [Meredithblackwellia eburnea MCA 4105]